jgi:predicted nuclease of restriction endonuclease-like RecB superfamily
LILRLALAGRWHLRVAIANHQRALNVNIRSINSTHIPRKTSRARPATASINTAEPANHTRTFQRGSDIA